MSTINGLGAYNSIPSSSATSQKKDGSTIGKEEFLKLLVTQMQKQDPLNPQDPSEFTAQLTQFSSLEQLIGVNQNLLGLSSQQSMMTRLNASTFIGKAARVAGDQVTVKEGTASSVRFDLSADSTKTSVNVYDAEGKLVEVVELGTQKAGVHDFQWDARTSGGARVADGNYHFEVVAQDSKAQKIDVNQTFSGKVTGVKFEYGKTLLEIGGASWPVENIVGLGDAS